MKEGFARALLAWYDRERRDLPWRRRKDPYHILVSEIMLQQTQVQTVLAYYEPFLERFPTAKALAEADEEEVLTAWKGLGYYRRAKNLWRAAQAICDTYGGVMPADYDELLRLPGIGSYTAAAVASIAFDLPHAVVDGNVLRVAARLFHIDQPVDAAPTKRAIADRMNALIDRERPGDFNQAMMELGQSICTVKSPDCGRCPVAAHCAAGGTEAADALPVRGRALTQKVEDRLVAVVFRGDNVLMRRREDDGLLAGMWEFLNVECKPDQEAEDVLRVHGLGGASAVSTLGGLVHRFSHLIWEMRVVRCVAPERLEPQPSYRWVHREEIDQLALPTAMQRVWDLARRP